MKQLQCKWEPRLNQHTPKPASTQVSCLFRSWGLKSGRSPRCRSGTVRTCSSPCRSCVSPPFAAGRVRRGDSVVVVLVVNNVVLVLAVDSSGHIHLLSECFGTKLKGRLAPRERRRFTATSRKRAKGCTLHARPNCFTAQSNVCVTARPSACGRIIPTTGTALTHVEFAGVEPTLPPE